MHLFYLDAYFRLASRGDKESFYNMYKLFLESAKIEMHAAKKDVSNLTGIPGDFSVYIDNLFFQILNDYNPDRGSFRWFTSYMLEHKLAPKVKQVVIDTKNVFTNIVAAGNDEHVFGIEDVPDPEAENHSLNLAMSTFKYKICSPSFDLEKGEKLQQDILLLQYAGYSSAEICKELRIKPSTLRYQQRKIKEDDVMLNLKLELK